MQRVRSEGTSSIKLPRIGNTLLAVTCILGVSGTPLPPPPLRSDSEVLATPSPRGIQAAK